MLRAGLLGAGWPLWINRATGENSGEFQQSGTQKRNSGIFHVVTATLGTNNVKVSSLHLSFEAYVCLGQISTGRLKNPQILMFLLSVPGQLLPCDNVVQGRARRLKIKTQYLIKIHAGAQKGMKGHSNVTWQDCWKFCFYIPPFNSFKENVQTNLSQTKHIIVLPYSGLRRLLRQRENQL